MTKLNQRPQGMSQLDYLWLNFGGYQIGSSPSSTPQQNTILNELAVTSLIKNATDGGIISLQYNDHPSDSNLMQLVGKSVDGRNITFVDMPKEVHVQSFVGRTVSQVDIDNGCPYSFGTKVLSIVLTNGKEFLVSLNSLGLVLQGAETKTSISEIVDGKVYNHVKIDKASLSVIELKESTYGLSAHLNISPDDTGVKLTKASNGLKAHIPMGKTGNSIKFDRMSLNSYLALPNKDDSTVYFITDKAYIFVGSQKYGVDIQENAITTLLYDREAMTLKYGTSENLEVLYLGPASEKENGMMSKDDYAELQKLKLALDGIVSVKQIINDEVDKLGASISYGAILENKRPLYLKNGKGDILSTVWTDVETYLANSLSKHADANDVIDANKAGVALEEGDKIIILTLTNGDKHYIKLQDLIVTQSFGNTKTITFTTNNTTGDIQANLNLSNNKILYIDDKGLSANIQIIQDGKLIKICGNTPNDLLGQFKVPNKELVKTQFLYSISEEQYQMNYPSYVDWKSLEDNPVVIGKDYYALYYQDYNTDEYIIYYITIPKPAITISPIQGNLLKQDDNGDYYVLFEWIEQ